MIPLVYRLRKEVRFVKRRDSWIAYCQTPLNVLHIGTRAYFILQMCDGLTSVHEIAQESGLAGESVFKLCDYFKEKAMLETAPVPNRGYFPFLSVIIPTKDRAGELVCCLESVSAQDYPKERLEVIVVDDGSKENIGDRLRAFPCRLIINLTSRGASFARNQGAREANGEILAFLDDDCVAGKTWLRELAGYFQWEEVGAVGGFVDGHTETSGLSRYEKAFSPLNLGSHILCSGNSSRFYIPTCNLLVRKIVFHQTGGMNENMHVGEDVDFCWRIQDESHYVLYIPAGTVRHRHRIELGTMLKRRYDYGISEAQLYKLHAGRKKTIQAPLAPASSFLALCLALFCSSLFPLIISFTGIAFESARKMIRIHKTGLSISFFRILFSVLRTHWFFIYSASFHFLRYYLILFILLGVFFPAFWLLAFIMILVSSSSDYGMKHPRLSFPAFAFYYVLEHLAYQIGAFIGCLKNRSFGTYIPQLICR